MKKSLLLISILSFLLFSSCGSDRLKVDVSDVSVHDIIINRLEQDIFNMDTTNIITSSKKLETKYGHFYSSFIRGIINNGGLNDSSYSYRIKQFISDKDMREAYADCQKQYANTDTLKDNILDAFKHFNHYFPNRKGDHLNERHKYGFHPRRPGEWSRAAQSLKRLLRVQILQTPYCHNRGDRRYPLVPNT